MGRGLIVGEPGRAGRSRARRPPAAFAHAGFDVTHSDDVRYDIWYKLWGNLTMNPVSAITGATVDRVLADPLVRAFCSRRDGKPRRSVRASAAPRSRRRRRPPAITARLGAFKTSMLRDVLAGRAIELDAIVGAVVEIGRPPRRADAEHRRAVRPGASVRPHARPVPERSGLSDAARGDARRGDRPMARRADGRSASATPTL